MRNEIEIGVITRQETINLEIRRHRCGDDNTNKADIARIRYETDILGLRKQK
jgi:hypothetical protein